MGPAIRDNKLEFEEIDKRIHEYNTTVRQNEISYKDYQGKDSSEIAQEYYDAAEEIYDSQPDLDPDSSSYASALASYINNEQRAESLKESGDASVEDEDTVKWSYIQAVKKAGQTGTVSDDFLLEQCGEAVILRTGASGSGKQRGISKEKACRRHGCPV